VVRANASQMPWLLSEHLQHTVGREHLSAGVILCVPQRAETSA
jgi:hypothetical protein